MIEINTIIQSDCLEGLRKLPDESVNCCVTSPPYFGLRDYGHTGQIGLEETPDEYVAKLVEVFREVKRVLRKDGTLWLNLGDSYAISGNQAAPGSAKQASNKGACQITRTRMLHGLKSKDLIGIPWMVAFALRSDGWYLRQDIIWHKPNPMPESVTDRCTKSHEYIFLLSKSAKYYYDQDAIKLPLADSSIPRLAQDLENQSGSDRVPGKTNGAMKAVSNKNMATKGQQVHSMHKARLGLLGTGFDGHSGNYDKNGNVIGNGLANKRSVWTVTTKPYSEAHFATYPEDLIIDCIKAGCPEGGLILDPFMGAGTTALVARKLNRNYIGFELNADYIRIAKNRLQTELGIFV